MEIDIQFVSLQVEFRPVTSPSKDLQFSVEVSDTLCVYFLSQFSLSTYLTFQTCVSLTLHHLSALDHPIYM